MSLTSPISAAPRRLCARRNILSDPSGSLFAVAKQRKAMFYTKIRRSLAVALLFRRDRHEGPKAYEVLLNSRVILQRGNHVCEPQIFVHPRGTGKNCVNFLSHNAGTRMTLLTCLPLYTCIQFLLVKIFVLIFCCNINLN